MDPRRSSMGAVHQQHGDNPGQAYEEVNTALQPSTTYGGYPPDRWDMINPRLLDLDDSHNPTAALQPHQSLDYGQSSRFLEVTSYTDHTDFSLHESGMQTGEGFSPQSTQYSSHALPPPELVDWQSTMGQNPLAQELMGVPEEHAFQSSSVINSTHNHHIFPDSYMLPGTGASSTGYGTSFDTFSGSRFFDQALSIGPIANNDYNSFSSNYNNWSIIFPPQTITNVSNFNTFNPELFSSTASNELPYSEFEGQTPQILQPPMIESLFTLPLSDALGHWSETHHQENSCNSITPTQYPQSSQLFCPLGFDDMLSIPPGDPYRSGHAAVQASQSMAAQSSESGFHQSINLMNQETNGPYSEYNPSAAPAYHAELHNHNDNVAVSVPPPRRLAIEDVSRQTARKSSILAQQRQVPTQDEALESNKPGINLNSMIEYVNPVIEHERERERRKIQKRTHKVKNGKVDRACFICQFKNRKCTPVGKDPCPNLKAFLKMHERQFSLPKFTCDVRTRFAELQLFSSQAVKQPTEDNSKPDFIITRSGELLAKFRTLLEPLLPVLDALEPDHPRKRLFRKYNFLYSAHSYGLSVIRWKAALVHLAPNLRRQIAHIEYLQERIGKQCLVLLDTFYTHSNHFSAACILSHFYDDVSNIKLLVTVNQSACDHLRYALEHRLFVLFGTLFGQDTVVKRPRRMRLNAQACVLRQWSDTTQFLPPQYQDVPVFEDWESECERSEFKCQNLHSDQGHSSGKKAASFCSWTMHCLPTRYLEMLDFPANDFCKLTHLHHERFESLYYTSIALNPDRTTTLLAYTYKLAIANLTQMYFSCLELEVTSSEQRLADYIKPVHNLGKVLLPLHCVSLGHIPLLAMEFSFKMIIAGMAITKKDSKRNLKDWICESGNKELYEAYFKLVICGISRRSMEQYERKH